MELSGAQILLECLKREGVEVVFGFPGGAVIDIYNEGLKSNSTAAEVRERWSYNSDPVYRYLDEFVEKIDTGIKNKAR